MQAPRLLLIAVKAGRKHLSIIEHHHISLVEEIDDFFEYMMAYLPCAGIEHHQATLVARISRILGNQIIGQFEFKLRELHCSEM